MTMRTYGRRFLTRRHLLRTGLAAGVISVAACAQQEEEPVQTDPVTGLPVPPPPPPPPPEPTIDSGVLRYVQDAVKAAARTLGADPTNVRFEPPNNQLDDWVDQQLVVAGVPSGHRNRDLIRELFSITVSINWSRPTLAEFESSTLPRLNEVLRSCYLRALGECERSEPTCDVDLATRFRAPGSPGGASSWVEAWWDYSSP